MLECEYDRTSVEYTCEQELVDLSTVKLRPFREDEVGKVAAMHRDIFPEYFLSHLGQSFMALFYREFVDNDQSCGYVAEYNGELIGFVAGTEQSLLFLQQLYKRNFMRLALLVMYGLLTDQVVRHNIRKRSAHLRYAWRALWKSNRSEDGPPKGFSSPSCSVLAIGVKPQFRRLGIAEKLLSEFSDHIHQKGVQKISLTVLPENAGAIAFYRKCGWYQESHSATSIKFSNNLSINEKS